MQVRRSLLYKILIEKKKCFQQIIRHVKFIGIAIYYCYIRIKIVIEDYYADKKLNIDTSGVVFLEENKGVYKDAYHYEPTPYRVLEKINSYLNMGLSDVFVDLGAGKGRVVAFVADNKNIKKVIGVESQREFFESAQDNLKKGHFKKNLVELICADVAEVKIKEGTVYYIFNAFGEKTLHKVIDNIRESLYMNPRKVRILYFQPAFPHILNNCSWLVPQGEIDKTKIFVWETKA